MNPLLEVNPAACLFVMGPQLSHKSARNPTRSNEVGADSNSQHQAFSSLFNCVPPATYRSILETGLRAATYLFSKPDVGSGQLLSKIEEIASEERLTVAMERLVELVKRQSCYSEWLKIIFQGEDDSFCTNKALQCQKSTNSEEKQSQGANATSQELTPQGMESVQHLLNLQKQGALLACTQYDTILDSVAGTRPVTLQDIDTLKHWSSLSTLPETTQDVHRRQPLCRHPIGILHLHGVHTNPNSIRLTDKEEGDSSPAKGRHLARDDPDTISCSSSAGMDILREIFRKRLVIFVGFDWEFFDPLLPGIMRNLYPDNKPGSLKNPPILLSSMPVTRQSSVGTQLPSLFLTLMVPKDELYDLSQVISPGSPKNFTVGKGLTDKQSSDGLKVQAFLLFNEKQSFRKLGDVIYQQSKSGEIYVRRDALTVIFDDNKILYGNLVTYGGNGLRQLWRLVFSEGSTLLGKGLMALGLQNAAIIWTNRKPTELGNVTGINSVHTYAAHKAVHTMAMAQQQQQSYLIHSSSGSSSGSVMPVSLTSSISTGNSVSLTNRTVTSQSSQQQLSSETKPTLQMALKSMTTSSCEHEIAGAGGKLEQRGSREIEEEDGDDNASKESSSTHNSDQNKSQAPISKYYHKSEFVAATTSSSKTLTATPAASIPNNFILTSGTNQTSSHVSKPSEVGPNLSSLQTSNVLNAAISNPLNAAISNPLLTGLNLFTVPGIGTPTGSLAGLVSPVLFTNNINPFLAVLGSSPNLLKFAPVTTTKSSPVGGVINTATAAAPVISYAPNQQASGVTSPQNLQLLSQLQERINAHLQSSTTLLTDSSTSLQRDMNNLLCLPRAGVSALEAASLSATSVLDQELSKRERKLELLAMGKSPVHCIASPPEILWSRHGALPSEHTIEYIDTLQLKVQSSRGSGPALESNYSIGKRAVSSRTGISNSNHEELTREIRNSGGSRKGCLEELPSESKPSNNSATRSDYHLNLLKLKPSKSHLTDSHSHLTSLSLPNTTVKTIPSSPLQADSSNLVSATISSPSSTQMSRLSTLQVAATPSEVKTSSVVTSLSSVPSATPMTPAVIPAGFPLIYAVPPTTAAATATHGLRTTPLASSPLRGDFYVMLNPSAATSGVGTCGSTTMQSLMIAAAPALATSTTSASVKHSPAELGVLPLQVPRLASGATGLIPSLGTTLSPVRAPMYYYIPNGGGSFQPTAAASVNAGLGTVAGRTPVTIGGTREDEEGKKSHTHHHGPSISQSSLLQAARTKKRPQSDLGETQFSKSEAKRMRMNATDIPWTNVKHQSEGPLCLRDVKVDCEEESGVADGAKAEECATASDTDDEVAVADMMFTHGGEGNKPFSYRGHLQLWEFLLDLLLTPNHGSIIQWTGNGYEFNIVNPEAMVRLWGAHKNKPHMTYEKMSRSLRYYYNQGIMDKVPGKRFTFKFAFDIQKYIIDNKKTSLFTLNP